MWSDGYSTAEGVKDSRRLMFKMAGARYLDTQAPAVNTRTFLRHPDLPYLITYTR